MPKFNDFGLSSIMGPQLRAFVEHQLADDLYAYGVKPQTLKFDWSDSCIEGHDAIYLDGSFENFSGIAVFNGRDDLIAEGWMDFVETGDSPRFIVYWDYVDIYSGSHLIFRKTAPGILEHVWERLPPVLKASNIDRRTINRSSLP